MPTLHGITQETNQAKLNKLNDESSFLAKLSIVFNTPDGLDVLDWILDKCYLHTPANSERAQGLQDWALDFFRTVNKADTQLAKNLLDRWHLGYAKTVRNKRQYLEQKIKEEKES